MGYERKERGFAKGEGDDGMSLVVVERKEMETNTTTAASAINLLA